MHTKYKFFWNCNQLTNVLQMKGIDILGAHRFKFVHLVVVNQLTIQENSAEV